MNQPATASIRNLMKLATQAFNKGRSIQLEELCKQILAIQPTNTKALHMLGQLYHAMGNYTAAEDALRRAIAADPNDITSYTQMTRALEAQERATEALQYANRATQIEPKNPEGHNAVVRLLLRFNNAHLALEYLEAIPDVVESSQILLEHYAVTLKVNEQWQKAEEVYQRLLKQYRVEPEMRFMFETYIPRLLMSQEEIDQIREKLLRSLEGFEKEQSSFAVEHMSYQNMFNLAFHNRDNKEIASKICRLFRKKMPKVNYVAPHCRKKPDFNGQRQIKLGFNSRYMHDHSVGRCYRNMMMYVAKQSDFKVTLFMQEGVVDAHVQAAKDAGVEIVNVPRSLIAAQQLISQHELDILVFTDIGMDAATSHLAMSRLAHYQCVLTGHPDTTGIDTLDYFISSRLYEPENAQENYTEKLLMVPALDTLTDRVHAPEKWLTRQELGLPEHRTLYVCPMAIQKLHPDFDLVVQGIIEKDPNAIVILFNDFQLQSASIRLQQRILSKCPADRVIFAPWLPFDKLLSVMKVADAVLVTVHFGAGTTGQYCSALGIPMVSMPGQFARSRVVYGSYLLMGVENPPIAHSLEEYSGVAVKLANNKKYYQDISTQLLENNRKIFEDNTYGQDAVELFRDIMKQDLEKYQ